MGQRGAIRWAGTREVNGKLLWNVSLDAFTAWVPGIVSNLEELEVACAELEATPEIVHTLSNIALLHLVHTRLRAVPLPYVS